MATRSVLVPEPTPTRWTAVQVHDMAIHIRTCRVCGDGGQDPEISAGLNEGFPPEEMADYIASGHHPAWLAMLAEGRAERERQELANLPQDPPR